MKVKFLRCYLLILFLAGCAGQQFPPQTARGITPRVPPVQAPEIIVAAMNRNYNELQNNCRERGTNLPRGHYYCSGVLLRTVDDGNFNPWNYSPSAIALGATSYSWIRHDVTGTRLYHAAGFILRNKTEANSDDLRGLETGFICLYPFDAGTLGNPNNHEGCGLRTAKKEAGVTKHFNQSKGETLNNNKDYEWGSCENVANIHTQAAWDNHFRANGQVLRRQCSWAMENQIGWNAMLASRRAFPGQTVWNEIMLKNYGNGDSLKPYIAAFFYDVSRGAAALTAAKNFQIKLNNNGYNVPILRLSFTVPTLQRFSYVAADQAVPQQ